MVGLVPCVLCQHRSVAQHRGEARHAGVLIAAGVVIAALGAGGAYAVLRGGDDSPGAVRTVTTTPSSGGSSSSTSTSTAQRESPSTTADPAAARAAEASRAMQACVATVRAQEDLATALAASARDWGLHTDAQRKFDNGSYTLKQTQAQWAASKARGPADLKAFTTATAQTKGTTGGCDGLVAATTGTEVASVATECQQRLAALAGAVKSGTTVHGQWAAHLTMMAAKAHTDGAAYHARWVGMVDDAGPALASYRSAAAALAKAPGCPS